MRRSGHLANPIPLQPSRPKGVFVQRLTLAGGVLLLWVCWKMYRELRSHGRDEAAPDEAMDAKVGAAVGSATIGAAIWQIVVADVSRLAYLELKPRH